MFKHILVPTDGSPLSQSTVERAIAFAKDAGARLTFFYAQPDFPMPIYGEGALIDHRDETAILDARFAHCHRDAHCSSVFAIHPWMVWNCKDK